MCAIGPGDWVECVDASPGAWTRQPVPLILGAVYRVAEVLRERYPAIRLVGVPVNKGSSGYRPERFRPIYRPKSELIQSLLKPVDKPVKEPA